MAGGFAAPIQIMNIGNHCGIDEGDLNHDGNLDLALVNWCGQGQYFYPGNGEGTFGQAVYLGSPPGYRMAVSVGARSKATAWEWERANKNSPY